MLKTLEGPRKITHKNLTSKHYVHFAVVTALPPPLKAFMEIEVAVPTPVPGTFTYTAPAAVPPGVRVLVPFGNRKLVGVVVGEGRAPSLDPAAKAPLLKPIEAVIDERPVYSPIVLQIARWISSYYLHPLGEVLRTMLPASASKSTQESYVLTPEGLAAMRGDGGLGLASTEGELLQRLFGKRNSVTAATLRSKLARFKREGTFAGWDTKQLLSQGLISLNRASKVRARKTSNREHGSSSTNGPAAMPTLTEAQQAAVDTMAAGFLAPATTKPFLLFGVTGSGKTEVYLRLIAAIGRVRETAQVLVLVPEISLTPQMTRIFEARFPGKVAVVHSAMSDAERWEQLERIRSGAAAILIGPRSAVFGPFADLKLILVDEEHDPSYKQSSGLAYHGRDVAVLRARLEGAVIVLGSATPSMESYHNALTDKYTLVELSERATGRPLPSIEVITAGPSFKRGEVVERRKEGGLPFIEASGEGEDSAIPIDPSVLTALEENLAAGRQSVVLVNRRGYAYYMLSVTKKKSVTCPQCSISLTLHKKSTVLRCHYCDFSTTAARIMAERAGEVFVAVGYGSEKAEGFLRAKLPGARIARLDSDTAAQKDVLPRTLSAFRNGEVDILVGTQILAKGHDFPSVTLIVVLEVDQLLDLPDFRAGERTFQLVVQAAGRAGRAHLPGHVLIQCLRPSHPVVQTAVAQDYRSFAARELEFRRVHGYPPFCRLVAVEFTSVDRARLSEFSERVESWFDEMQRLRPAHFAQVRVLGPAAPPIEMIRNRHRRKLLFAAAAAKPLHEMVGEFAKAFAKLPGDLRLRVDVDPQSLI